MVGFVVLRSSQTTGIMRNIGWATLTTALAIPVLYWRKTIVVLYALFGIRWPAHQMKTVVYLSVSIIKYFSSKNYMCRKKKPMLGAIGFSCTL